MSKLNSRVDALERGSGGGGVVALWMDDDEHLKVLSTGEELTIDEFSAKYPDGVICHRVYVNWDEHPTTKKRDGDIVVNWDDGNDE